MASVMQQKYRIGNLTHISCCVKWVVRKDSLQDEKHISMFCAYSHWHLWILWLLLPSAVKNPGATSLGAIKPLVQCCFWKISPRHCCSHILPSCHPAEINTWKGCARCCDHTEEVLGFNAPFCDVFIPGDLGTTWRQWRVSVPAPHKIFNHHLGHSLQSWTPGSLWVPSNSKHSVILGRAER